MVTRTCPVCEQQFGGDRASRVYCSGRCRQKALRQRRAAGQEAAPRPRNMAPPRPRYCRACGSEITAPRRWAACDDECQRILRNARRRNRDHIQRASVSDVTAQIEQQMRRRAGKCPLCEVVMTDKPCTPASKELDHIVPVCMGGTHTLGNVRIICRRCNQSRPKDGSDYEGQLTLWASGPAPVGRQQYGSQRTRCGNGLHEWIPANIAVFPDGHRYCLPCKRARDGERRPGLSRCACGNSLGNGGRTFMCADCLTAAGHRAAALHVAGMTWDQVAAEVGYASAEGARYAARRAAQAPAEPASRDRTAA